MAGAIAALLFAILAPDARAANIWTGAGGDGNWSTGANWDTGTAPVSNSDVTFSGSTRLEINYDMPPTYDIRSMTFDTDAGAYVFNGNEMRVRCVRQTVITNRSPNTQTYNTDLNFYYYSTGGDTTITFPGGGPIVLNGTTTYDRIWLLLNNSAGTLVLNGQGIGQGISYIVSYVNDIPMYTFRYNIADCILELGHPQALGEGGVHMQANGTLRAGVALTGASAIPNGFVIGNANIFTISGSNDIELSGNIYNSGGNRRISITNTGETIFSGTVCLANEATGRTLTFSVPAAAGKTTVRGAILNRSLSATGSTASVLNKIDAGDLHLEGANAYTGNTTIADNGGGLYVNGSHMLEPAGASGDAGYYSVGRNVTLGGSGTIRPAAGDSTLPGLDRMKLADGAKLRPGDAAIPTNTKGVIPAPAQTLTLDHSQSKPQVLVNFTLATVSLQFALGGQGTNTKVAVTGRAGATGATLKFAGGAGNKVHFTDVAAGKLDAGDYILVSTDGGADTYSGLTVDDNGVITGGLSIGTGLEYYLDTAQYAGATLMYINNNIVLRVLPPPAPVVTNTDLDMTIGQHSYFDYQITATNYATGYSVEGVLPDNVTLDPETGVLSGTPASEGVYPVSIKAINAGGSDAKTLTITVMPVEAAPTITSHLVARPIKGEFFSYTIVADNYASTYEATGLPSWLSLSRNVISGTVPYTETEGDMPVTIGATNGLGTDTRTLTLTILPVLKAPVITGVSEAAGVVTKPFQYQITADNMPSHFSASGLPEGVTVNATTGLISGRPVRVGVYSVTLIATNSGGSGTARLAVTINNIPGEGLAFYTPGTAGGATGKVFTFTVAADGDPAAASYSARGLPPGLAIDAATGVISGEPSASGVFQVEITASSEDGKTTGSSTLTITITGDASIETRITGLSNPTAAVMDASGATYIAGTGGGGIIKIDADDTLTTLAPLPSPPLSLAIDAQGNLYAGASDGAVYKITSAGTVTVFASGFSHPGGLAVSAGGTLYVADTGNNQIKAITPGGTVTTLAGSGAQGSADNAIAADATFDGPGGLALNASTNTLYIADTNNSTLRAIDLGTGAVTTAAGVAGQPYNLDGTGATVRFNTPEALAIDNAGLIYVADTGNNTVRVFDPVSKTVSTVIGDPENTGSADGPAGAALLNGPAGIVINTHGDGGVYVVDTGNGAYRSLTASPVIVTPLPDRVARTRTRVTFDGAAWGSPAPAYTWLKDGAAIAGAAGAVYTIDYVKEADAGSYTLAATNDAGQAAGSFTLTVTGKDYDTTGTDGAGSSGGGATGAWFPGMIAVLAFLRIARQNKPRR
jgi:autotransporter-associated beta strand protein